MLTFDRSLYVAFAFRPPSRRHRSLALVLLGLLLLALGQRVAAAPAAKVLVLYSDNQFLPALLAIDQTLTSTLHAGLGDQVEVFNELLDLGSIRDERYPDDLAAFLQRKYAGEHINAIVAVQGPALKFLLDHRGQLLPGVPIVHAQVSKQELQGLNIPADVIGAPLDLEPEKTLELALRLHPATERVVVITGTSPYDLMWESVLRNAFAPFVARLPVEYWTGLTMPQILQRVAALSPHTIVFLPGFRQDVANTRLVPQQVAAAVVAASPAPVYGNSSNFAPDGTMGGYIASLEESARQTAILVERIVHGEKVAEMAPVAPIPNGYVLNAHQLQRFGVPDALIPADAVMRYREPSPWRIYRWQIIGAILLVALQAALIAALLVQRRVRRRAETDLRETEHRVNLAANATGIGLWTFEFANGTFWANAQHHGLMHPPPDAGRFHERLLGTVHPEDDAVVAQALAGPLRSGGDFDVLYRTPAQDPQVRWVSARGTVEVDGRGRPVRARGATADVTPRMQATLDAERHRNELAHLSRVGMLGQLSGSIAHELNQPLTAILSNAQAALRFMKQETVDLEELREILNDIVVDDQRAGDIIRRLRALFERGDVKRDPIDINHKVREVLRLLRSDLVSRNVVLATDLDDGLPVVLGDRVQLQQLLLNLVLNACEAMADMPVSERRISIRTRPVAEGQIIVSVVDNGKGIAPNEVESIFDPFVTSKALGVGLGLVISRSIVEAHGGKLWATNNFDRGATFSFALPVAEASGAKLGELTPDSNVLEAGPAAR